MAGPRAGERAQVLGDERIGVAVGELFGRIEGVLIVLVVDFEVREGQQKRRFGGAGAEEELRRSLAIKADHLDAKYALGQSLQQRGARQQADTLFAELESQRRLDPDFQEARGLLDRGLGEVVGGQWVAARNSFQAALRYRPEYPEAHAQLGEIFLRLGEAESAIGHFRAAIDIKDDALTFYGLSRALTKRGDTVAAQEALRRARELDPEVGISGLAVRP